MAAGLDLTVRKGYMCRLRSVSGTGYLSVRSTQLQNLLSPILWMVFATTGPFDGLWSRCLQSTIWRALQLERKEFNDDSNRALVWLAFATCEVLSATQLSIHGRLSPIGQQAASLKFFCPTAPSLHKVELASLEGIRTVYLEQVPLRGNCD